MQNCQWNQLMLSDLLEINTPSSQIVDLLMQSLGCREFFLDIDDILIQYLNLCILIVVLLQFILRLPIIPKL